MTQDDDARHKQMVSEGWSFRPTTDDWSRTFPDGTVALRLLPDGGYWCLLVKGTDDTSMEYGYLTKADAMILWASLPSIITMADLRERGFVVG